jgi:hypothetical protein
MRVWSKDRSIVFILVHVLKNLQKRHFPSLALENSLQIISSPQKNLILSNHEALQNHLLSFF